MAITEIEPRALVEAHKSGDGEAFETIVRTHHQGLLAHALTRLRDVQAAEDAVQETFARAFRAMPDFEGDFHLRAWLHRILTNVCHDEGARRQRDVRLFERVSGQTVTSIGPVELDDERLDFSREVVAAALDSLPASYREALTLRYVEDLPYERVAAATGVSEGNARIRVMRARTALRRALTSSHAMVIALVPWLRRPGRGSVVDLPSLAPSIAPSVGTTASIAPSIGATASVAAAAPSIVAAAAPSIVAQVPLLMRAADHAPQLAERAASIPQVLGLVAAMAVPIGAPVVSDQISSWATPPPAVAAPAPGGAVTGGTAVPRVVASIATPTAAPAAGSVPVVGSVGAALAATASGVPPVRTTTSPLSLVAGPAAATPTISGTLPSAGPLPTAPPTSLPTVQSPKGATAAVPVRGGKPAPVVASPVVVAPLVFRSTISGTSVMDVETGSAELTGTVMWDDGEASVAGQLTGTVSLAPASGPPAPVAPPAAPDGSSLDPLEPGPAPEPLPAESVPPAEPGPAPEPLPAESVSPAEPVVVPPTAFAGTLSVSLDDGRTFSLRLVDGSLDRAGAWAGFERLDACDGVVASGALVGTLDIGSTAEPVSFELALEGERLAEAPACD